MNHVQEPEERKTAKSRSVLEVPKISTNSLSMPADIRNHIKKNSNNIHSLSVVNNQKTSTTVEPNGNLGSTNGFTGNAEEKKLTTPRVQAVRGYRPAIEGGREIIQQL